MKKSYMLMALAVSFMACSSEDRDNEQMIDVEQTNNLQETKGVLTPEADLDEPVITFFNHVSYEGTYFFAQQYEQENTCLIFNSEEEMEARFCANFQILHRKNRTF